MPPPEYKCSPRSSSELFIPCGITDKLIGQLALFVIRKPRCFDSVQDERQHIRTRDAQLRAELPELSANVL